jgi:hypothetical protein
VSITFPASVEALQSVLILSHKGAQVNHEVSLIHLFPAAALPRPRAAEQPTCNSLLPFGLAIPWKNCVSSLTETGKFGKIQRSKDLKKCYDFSGPQPK